MRVHRILFQTWQKCNGNVCNGQNCFWGRFRSGCRSVTFEWFKRFKDDRQFTEDDSRSRRPPKSQNDDVVVTICENVRNYCRLTVRKLENEAGISIGFGREMLTENLQTRRVAQKFVPRLLTMEQKEKRLTTYQELKNRPADDEFHMKHYRGWWVMGLWIRSGNKVPVISMKSKIFSSAKKSLSMSNVKIMVIVFFFNKLNFCNYYN